jgi:transposase-like protein
MRNTMGNMKFDFEDEVRNCKSLEDVTGKDGLIQKMLKNVIESMLDKEMQEYMGREKHHRSDVENVNYRNGTTPKTLKTGFGKIKIEVPRDRNGEFQPEVIKKYETMGTGLEAKIISMYSKGMSTRDIKDHIQDIYGTDISPTTISNITDKVMGDATEWFSRPLDSIYPIVFMDAIHFKVRTDGRICNRAAYVCEGINQDGKKDILGIWIGENEGAKFWLGICNELRNRGVKDILIACIDGLTGFPDAIRTAFPNVVIQLCIIHQIRNTIKYVASKEIKEFMKDLKLVYRAASEDIALTELDNLSQKWGKKYSVVIDSWLNKWTDLSAYFKYPDKLRKQIYTTNTVEGFNRQLRKATKVKTMFPTDESLKKSLYLATIDITKKWTSPVPNWGETITQFAITFEGRLDLGFGV